LRVGESTAWLGATVPVREELIRVPVCQAVLKELGALVRKINHISRLSWRLEASIRFRLRLRVLSDLVWRE
jgi:hypothetical protein